MSATAERLATLVDALASEQGIDEVGMALLSRGIAATGATAGVCVVVTDGGELEMAASVGYDEHLLVPWNRFTVDRQVPVADAVRTGRVVVLTSNEEAVGRYPELEPFISEGEAMAAFPIVDGGRPIGAVALRFDVTATARPPAVGDGSGTHDGAGAALSRAVVPALVERVAQLQGALTTRVVVEQAKGILAERHGISLEDAFERLRAVARSRSARVQQIAGEVVDGSLDL